MPATSANVVSDSTGRICCLKREPLTARSARADTATRASSSSSGAQVCTQPLMFMPPPAAGAVAAAGGVRSGGATLKGTSPIRAAATARGSRSAGRSVLRFRPSAVRTSSRPASPLVTRAEEAVPS